MDISPLVLAAIMNLMNVETEDDCEELFMPAEVAMYYHQAGSDYDPNNDDVITSRPARRAIQRLLPETKDTPRCNRRSNTRPQ